MQASVMLPFQTSGRRAFRLVEPRQQARLTTWMLGISAAFVALVLGNSYAAYGSLMDSLLASAPKVFGPDFVLQTRHYVVVSLVLVGGYGFAMMAACIAFVHRLSGPMVALERQVEALKRGDYRARVRLRNGSGSHARLAQKLNSLASDLEAASRSKETAAVPMPDSLRSSTRSRPTSRPPAGAKTASPPRSLTQDCATQPAGRLDVWAAPPSLGSGS